MTPHLRHIPAWMPSSPCGPGCTPADGGGAGAVRVAARLTGLTVVLLGLVLGTPLLRGQVRERWLGRCSRAALRAAGIRLSVRGDRRFVDGTGALVVANHLSWIDVLALCAVQPVRMLAKREVGDWPVLGGLARSTGALFVDRAGLRALPTTVAETAATLRAGGVVGVFPEGTTWCGAAAGPFRRAAFQAAIDAGAPVRPVAIALRSAAGTPARAAAFVGDQCLLDSVLTVLCLPSLVCELTVLPTIAAAAATDRRELAGWAGEAVASVSGVRHPPGPARRPGGVRRAVADPVAA